jgi:hypothetical protein
MGTTLVNVRTSALAVPTAMDTISRVLYAGLAEAYRATPSFLPSLLFRKVSPPPPSLLSSPTLPLPLPSPLFHMFSAFMARHAEQVLHFPAVPKATSHFHNHCLLSSLSPLPPPLPLSPSPNLYDLDQLVVRLYDSGCTDLLTIMSFPPNECIPWPIESMSQQKDRKKEARINLFLILLFFFFTGTNITAIEHCGEFGIPKVKIYPH